MKKTLTYSLALVASLLFCIQASSQEYRKDRLFMPKGTSSGGLQISYVDLSSIDSDIFLIVDGLNAEGTMISMGVRSKVRQETVHEADGVLPLLIRMGQGVSFLQNNSRNILFERY